MVMGSATATTARRKANRLRIVCDCDPRTIGHQGHERVSEQGRPPPPWRGGGASVTGAGTDGALWSRLMNTIRRFYRSTPEPSSRRREVQRRRGRSIADGRTDGRAGENGREPALNSSTDVRARAPSLGARCTTRRNHAHDSSRYLLGRCANSDTIGGVGRWLSLIEGNGIRPQQQQQQRRRRHRLFVDLSAVAIPSISRSSALLSAGVRPPTTKCIASVSNHISSNLATSSPAPRRIPLFLRRVPGKQTAAYIFNRTSSIGRL